MDLDKLGYLWQNRSQTLTVTNFVHMDPFELAPNPKYRGKKALQNGPKTVKNGVLLTKLWLNKIDDQ